MKRYDRVLKFFDKGFKTFIIISICINIALFMAFNKIITSVYFDVRYKSTNSIYSSNNFEIPDFASIKFISLEAVTKLIAQFTLSAAEVSQTTYIMVYLIIVKCSVSITVFIINYYCNTLDLIQQIISSEITIDLCCIFPYLLMLRKFAAFRKLVPVEMEQQDEKQQETMSAHSHSTKQTKQTDVKSKVPSVQVNNQSSSKLSGSNSKSKTDQFFTQQITVKKTVSIPKVKQQDVLNKMSEVIVSSIPDSKPEPLPKIQATNPSVESLVHQKLNPIEQEREERRKSLRIEAELLLKRYTETDVSDTFQKEHSELIDNSVDLDGITELKRAKRKKPVKPGKLITAEQLEPQMEYEPSTNDFFKKQ
ncbi:Hypothetical_protein [Hexamita inflata]|uniref:Hypothetical_protein n=1 Tax=Hexamita inflata TaxID=28002 RepID=A0AA86UH99_9EUKA|nr:Hypothetical protein HINF_LOCUS45765 [Hexamita inflata]